jgi:GNAT superfamily N-acetyltransferase
MSLSFEWRGAFENAEVDALHAEAFGTGDHRDHASSRTSLVATHSLGWVTARDHAGLVGFVNVLWDGLTHAWVQDTMVAGSERRRGIGSDMMAVVRVECQKAGCEWLHVDFDESLGEFYFQACGFTPTTAGLMRLS